MKKNLLALAVAGAIAAPAAHADAVLYGTLRVHFGVIGNGDDVSNSVSSNVSRLGVRGSEALGNGMTAKYGFEWDVNASDETGSGEGNFDSRNQWVGLAAQWGEIRIGRHDTAYKRSTNTLFGQFGIGNSIADYHNIVGSNAVSQGAFDSRLRNAVNYIGKTGNFDYEVSYATDQRNRGDLPGPTSQDDVAFGGYVTYNGPNWAVGGGAANEKVNNLDNWQARTYAKLELPSLMLGGIVEYGELEEADGDDNGRLNVAFGGIYTYSSRIKFHGFVGWAGDTDSGEDDNSVMLSGALAYSFSKRTKIMGIVSTMLNDDNANFGLRRAVSDAALPADPGEDPFGAVVQIVHNF